MLINLYHVKIESLKTFAPQIFLGIFEESSLNLLNLYEKNLTVFYTVSVCDMNKKNLTMN